jgi:hypothetical protein
MEQIGSEHLPNSSAGLSVPADGRSLSAGRILVGVLLSPKATFEEINQNPSWVAPILIAIAVSILFWLFHGFVIKADWVKISQGMMTRARSVVNSNQGAEANSPVFVGGLTILRALAAIPILDVVIAGATMVALLATGARVNFKKVLSVVAWTYCSVGLVSTIILASVLFVQRETYRSLEPQFFQSVVPSSLGVLISYTAPAALWSLASSIDLFSIWSLVLLVIGLGVVSGPKKGTTSRAAFVVFGLWGFYVLVKAGFAAMF